MMFFAQLRCYLHGKDITTKQCSKERYLREVDVVFVNDSIFVQLVYSNVDGTCLVLVIQKVTTVS